MPGIILEELEVLFGEIFDGVWKSLKAFPKANGCAMHLEFLQASVLLFIQSFFDEEVQRSGI